MKHILVALGILFILPLHAQLSNYSVSGKILEAKDSPLIGATAVLLSPIDSTMAAFAVSELDGSFIMEDVEAGKYTLQITYIGYGTIERPLDATGDNKNIDLGEVIMAGQANMLDAVEVVGEFIPLVIKKDTVEYSADAFKVRPNATVEELLKRLPGVEVDADGNITSGGEAITNVLVDGKRFFGDDPKMATRNLQAANIKKVQVYERKSEAAEFSGVDDGLAVKTINLELKENAKVGLFGNVEAGYGTDNRYNTKANISKFNDKYQLAGVFALNNINQQGFTASSLTGGGGGGRGGFGGGGMGTGLTTSLTGGLNFSYTPSKKIEFTTSYFLSYTDRQVEDFTDQFYFDDESHRITDGTTGNQSLGHTISSRLSWLPSQIQRVDLELSFRNNGAENRNVEFTKIIDGSGDPLNTVDFSRIGEGAQNNFSGSFDYNLRLGKPGRILSLESSLGYVASDDSLNVEQITVNADGSPPRTDDILQDQISDNSNNNFSVRVNYKEPLGNNHFLDVNYTQRNNASDRMTTFFDIDPINRTIKDINDILSTATNNDVIYNRAGMTYTKNHEKFLFITRFEYQRSTIKGGLLAQEEGYKFDYFLPSLEFRHVKTNFRLQYRTTVNEPSIDQLQPIQDNSRSGITFIGNPDLRPEYRHNLNARYFFFDRFNFRNLFANATYSYATNSIVNSVTFTEDRQQIQRPVNVRDNTRLSGSLNFSSPIRPLYIKTTIRGGANWSRAINFADGLENIQKSTTPTVGLEIENLNNQFVSLVIRGNIGYTTVENTINDGANRSYYSQTYGANFFYDMGKGFGFDSSFDLVVNDKSQVGDDNTFALWNANLTKRVMNDRLTFKLTAFDILKQNVGVQVSNTPLYLETARSNTMQNYYMLSAIYQLSSFSPQQGGGNFGGGQGGGNRGGGGGNFGGGGGNRGGF